MNIEDALKDARLQTEWNFRTVRNAAEAAAERRIFRTFYVFKPCSDHQDNERRFFRRELEIRGRSIYHGRKWGAFCGKGWRTHDRLDTHDAEAIVREAGDSAVLEAMRRDGWTPSALRPLMELGPELASDRPGPQR